MATNPPLLGSTSPLKVACLLIDHDKTVRGQLFFVTCATGERVGDLKQKVKERLANSLSDVDDFYLTIFKCTDDFDEADQAKLQSRVNDAFDNGKCSRLSPRTALDPAENVTYVVQKPEVATQAPALAKGQTAEEAEEAKDNIGELTTINRRNKRLETINKESISIDDFPGVKLANKYLFTGRVNNQWGHPVSIYHPVLAQLKYRLENLDSQAKRVQRGLEPLPGLIKLDKAMVDASRVFFQEARAFHKNEDEYVPHVHQFFGQIFGHEEMQKQVYSDGSIGEGDKTSKGSQQGETISKGLAKKGVNKVDVAWLNYVAMEIKNEYGIAGDASLQVLVWYAKHCGLLKEKYPRSILPCILIGVMGNVIEVAIAVCLEEVLVENVLHFKITQSTHDDQVITILALIASALKVCAKEVRAEYMKLDNSDPKDATMEETWHLPHPSVVPSPNTSMPTLTFRAKLHRSNTKLSKPKGETGEMRSLFLADYHPPGPRNDEGVVSSVPAEAGSPSNSAVETVVKFADKYNSDSHRLLADRGYAPKLYECEPVIGGVQMVVMERVVGKRMFDKAKKSLPKSVFEEVHKALKMLHDAGLVFGDLRDTNIMIVEGNDGTKIQLVDFDWAAKEKEGRYPADINTTLAGGDLASDVAPLGTMYQKHDLFALDFLVGKYCNDTKYAEQMRKTLLDGTEY